MLTLDSIDDKINTIINSLQEIKETREGVIKLLEWKTNITDKIERIENEKHKCEKEKDFYELSTSVTSINRWKWWVLGVLVIACSSLIGFAIDSSSNYTENKTYINNNKDRINKIDNKIETMNNKIQIQDLRIQKLE